MKTEKNIIYPPEFFVEGMRVKTINGTKTKIINNNLIIHNGEVCGSLLCENTEFWLHFEVTPILPKLSFSPDMLKALLAGNKTQTTRKAVTKTGKFARRFKVGDVIGVGESYGQFDFRKDSIIYSIDGLHCKLEDGNIITHAGNTEAPSWRKNSRIDWCMGATLPTWAVRHFIRIKTVELKRPCEFTDKEILAEGITPVFTGEKYEYDFDGYNFYETPKEAWKTLLKSIHKNPSGFEAFWNNLQIVYTFELIR